MIVHPPSVGARIKFRLKRDSRVLTGAFWKRAIKLAADIAILQGSDTTNTQTLSKLHSDKFIDVELFLIEDKDIDSIDVFA